MTLKVNGMETCESTHRARQMQERMARVAAVIAVVTGAFLVFYFGWPVFDHLVSQFTINHITG